MPPKRKSSARKGPKARDPSKMLSKSQLQGQLAEATGLSKKDVGSVIDALVAVSRKELRGVGKIKLFPGLILKKKETKARPARMARNPFTGEMGMQKAKPAGRTVRATIGKDLKEMVA